MAEAKLTDGEAASVSRVNLARAAGAGQEAGPTDARTFHR